MFKKLINRFRSETWEKVSDTENGITVYRYGFPIDQIPCILTEERSNKGNVRFWLTEKRGVRKNQPYLVDPKTGKPC